jgi:LPXTG-motif cell wall-anchored protein
VFRPLVVVADVIPLFGDLLQMGIGIFALLVAVPLSLITISIGWVFYRPLIGIPLLVAGVAALVGAFVLFRKKKKTA